MIRQILKRNAFITWSLVSIILFFGLSIGLINGYIHGTLFKSSTDGTLAVLPYGGLFIIFFYYWAFIFWVLVSFVEIMFRKFIFPMLSK